MASPIGEIMPGASTSRSDIVMLPPQQGRDDSLRARLAQGREANLPRPIEVWGTGEAWTGRPCEGPRGQTCPAYRRRAHSGLTTIEAVEDGWCRRCISHAMASGSQTVRLR